MIELGAGLLFLGALLATGVWWKSRVPLAQSPPEGCPVPTPLGRSLFRQAATPDMLIGTTIAVIPILAYHTYSLAERRLYDGTRAVDTALLAYLTHGGSPRWVKEQHVVTRRIRRALMLVHTAAKEVNLSEEWSKLDAIRDEIQRRNTRQTFLESPKHADSC